MSFMDVPEPNSDDQTFKKHKDEIEEGKQEEEKVKLSHAETISKLPKAKGWISENLYLYQGFWCLDPSGVLSMQEHFKARSTDVILLTAFKSGTTWLKALAFAIINRGRYKKGSSTHPLLISNPHECVRTLEFTGMEDVESMPSPRILGTHVPYTSLPECVSNSGCRVICMGRDPKDALVSMWHFANKGREGIVHVTSLHEAFESFCLGVSPYGPYWDNVLGYYKASLQSPETVLFLKYEDMHSDTTNHVKRLAEFLGYPFSLDEEADGVVQDIIDLCSFENLSNLEVNKTGSFLPYFKNDSFFRKGKVGDSGNYLTPDMIAALDQISNTKFDAYGISFQ